MWGSWRPNRTATYWPPHSFGHQRFFPVLHGFSTGGPGAQLSAGCWLSLPHLISQFVWYQNCSIGGLRAPSAGCWLSLPYLVSDWSGLQTNWLPVFTELYNSSTPTLPRGRHNFALIQPVQGQGYDIPIIPRPDAPVIYIGAFPILTARTGRRSIYNTSNKAFIRWWLWVQAWFRGRSIIATSPERPSSISRHHQTLSDCCRSVGLPDPCWYIYIYIRILAPPQRGTTLSKSVLCMTLNNLMVRLLQCLSFGECGVPLYWHRIQVNTCSQW